jgi:hypothetical protein
MLNFEINTPVELTIDKTLMTVDTSKMHPTWLAKCLEYGIRRYVNDTNSGFKGSDKQEACKLTIKELTNGNAMPEKTRRSPSASADPITALAMKNAKTALTAIFKAVTEETSAIEFAKHPKVAPFFVVTEDRAVWRDVVVAQWMQKQALPETVDGVDYMAQAATTLNGASNALSGLDF